MVDTYAKAKADSTGLRSVLGKAVSGILSVFNREPEDGAGEEEAKLVGIWQNELDLADTFFKDFDKDGLRAVNAFRDESNESLPLRPKYKLNLFHANVTTLMSIMYAKLPKVEADRRFADPNDDVARVASAIISRLLENDMNDPEDRLNAVLRQALQDRLTAGLGMARIRYCMEEEGEGEAAVKKDEWCDLEYVHWRDVRWSPCRTHSEMRWIAFRCYMTKSEVSARFGEAVAATVPYSSRGAALDPDRATAADPTVNEATAQAEIWEIWDKQSHRVLWFVKGFGKFLDAREDPMKLAGFFPNPPPLVANTTTLKYLPKPDYLMAEDLYEEINELEARIALLTKACKAVGVYPASATEIGRILTEAVENQLVPVDNWAMFSDKGGLKGQIDYFPIKDVAETLSILIAQQQLRIQQLYQVTGMSDIIRGQASSQGVTATEQRIKAQFASTRMQAFQDEFAKFAEELLNLKVQLIRKYYDPDRIVRLSNIGNTPDAEHVPAAIQLIKDEAAFDCRIAVRAESMAQIDYDALKTERSEFLGAVAAYLQAAAPMIEMAPQSGPFLLELLKFNLAGMKGAKDMEGVVDRMVATLIQAEQEKASKPPEPSPEEKAEQIKVQGQVQVAQVKAQADQQANQQTAMLEMQKMQLELQQSREEHALKMQEMEAKIALLFAQLQIKQQEGQMKVQQQAAEAEMDIEAREREMAHEEMASERELEHEDRRFAREEKQAERSFERESEQADQRFKQESKHADQKARRESSKTRGEE